MDLLTPRTRSKGRGTFVNSKEVAPGNITRPKGQGRTLFLKVCSIYAQMIVLPMPTISF